MELVNSVYSGNEVDINEATEIEGFGWIADSEIQHALKDGAIVQCHSCGDLIGADVAQRGADDNMYCSECFDEEFFICEHCDRPEYRDEAYVVYIGDHPGCFTEYWCSDCADNDATRCVECGRYFSESLTETHNGDYVCCSCLEEYRQCDECGEWYPYDEGEWDECNDSWYCNGCLDSKINRRVIHGYHDFQPKIKFFGAQSRRTFLHMGVELEIDGAGEYSENAFQIVEAGNNGINDTITCMHDGSLDRGFEIISQPATLQYHREFYGWDKMMREAKRLGYKSHDAGTCGMHVHVDREYFYDAFCNAEYALGLLVVNNSAWLKEFSRRNDFYYCKFPNTDRDYACPYIADDFIDKKCEKDGKRKAFERLYDLRCNFQNHYTCINVSNYATIEFRFFRGTLKYSTFIANLQLVQMMCYAAKKFRYEQLCSINLHWFLKLAKHRGYTEFINYASKRLRGHGDED